MTFTYYRNAHIVKAKKKNDMVTNKQDPGDFEQVWTDGTCLIVRHSILTGADKMRLSKQSVIIITNLFISLSKVEQLHIYI